MISTLSSECQRGEKFKQARANGRRNCESRQGSQMSPRLLQMLIVFHGGSAPIVDVVSFQVQTELSFVVASLSFFSAHVSVYPTVAVVLCWTEANVDRKTTKIENSVSSRSSPVPSLALCVGSSDQRDGNQCCPSFDGSVCVIRRCVCVCVHVECVFVCTVCAW